MKKKYLPIAILMLLLFLTQDSHAITMQEVEGLMDSLIHGTERDIPCIKPVLLPNLNTIQQGTQKQNNVVLEQEKLENDPYSYDIPEDRVTKVTKPTQNTNTVKIPHFNSENDETPKTESVIPTIPLPGTEQTTQPLNLQDENVNKTPEETESPQLPLQQLTRREVFLTCLTKMGWASTLSLLNKLVIFEEYASFSSVDYVRTNMRPAPPSNLFTPAEEIFPNEDIIKLKEWAKKCVKNVQLETRLTVNGNSLYLIKRGVPPSSGYVQDMKAKNVPLFIVYYIHNTKKNMAEVAPAEQLGLDKLPLSTIAHETEGAEFAINGGYFGVGVGQIIGVLRFRGNTMRQKFCPHRSGIAWNNNGEHKFFDGRITQTIVSDRSFDKYTEVFQAGPMLISNGQISQNKEDLDLDIMNKRHPRTFVAEQPDGTLVWGVVDGRNAAHSVGMTIAELKQFCKERHFVNALNLDGGGSSSVWWNGLSFSKPCNIYGAERKIPYAIVIYRENAEAICEPIEFTPPPQQE